MSKPYSFQTDYAFQGNACQASLDTVVSNTKFLPLNEPLYDQSFTYMQQYPGHVPFYVPPVKEPKKKINQEKCCGRK